MNKFIKYITAGLFSLAIVACGDKADPKADFQKVMQWQDSQMQMMTNAQVELQQKLMSSQNDPKQVEAIVQEFAAKVKEAEKSLNALDVKSDEVKAFKQKTQEAFKLSSELMEDSLKVLQTPESAATLAEGIQQKTTKAMEAQAELQKLQADLKAKYGDTK